MGDTLRTPFPPERVGKLPRSTCRDCSNSARKRCDRHTWVTNCPECHGGHSSATMHLDYVGHADVTDRLLTVDPGWTWEPMALTAEGLPATDKAGNLWIRLTVGGVTRIGVGDGKNAKECIGDALRNAAMRFGVALDLWAKGDRSFGEEGQVADRDSSGEAQTLEPDPVDPSRVTREKGDPLGALKAEVWAAAQKVGIRDKQTLAAHYAEATGGLVLSEADETALKSYLDVLASQEVAA